VGARFSAPVRTGPGAHPVSCIMGTGSFPRIKSGRGVMLTPHPLLVPWSRKGRTIPLLPLLAVRSVQSLSACTVHLYLYSHYGSYGLYRASVPVQYSYTSTPPIGRTACTEPQCLYSTAILLPPLWAVRPVQSLSACTRVRFTFTFLLSCCQLETASDHSIHLPAIKTKHKIINYITKGTWATIAQSV